MPCFKDKTVALIGKFDGVHKGHRELLLTASYLAKKEGLSSVCYIVAPRGARTIIPSEKRDEIIKSYGIDECIVQNLTDGFMNMSPEDFVNIVLKDTLNCAHVVVGYNFRFAKNRAGDASCLSDLCHKVGIGCTVIPEVRCDIGKDIITASSSNIRKALESGDVKTAAKILGRSYSVSGEVIHGRKIGRTLDFPTANIIADTNIVIPKNGVYRTNSIIDGVSYVSVTNIGVNPTVNTKGNITIETHLPGTDIYLYGRQVTIEFKDRIRDEMKFESLDELKRQIKSDIDICRSE